MQLTGVAGEIVGWVILITAYTIIALGIFSIWYYFIIEVMLRYVLKALKVYKRFVEFLWCRRAFKEWLKTQKKQS